MKQTDRHLHPPPIHSGGEWEGSPQGAMDVCTACVCLGRDGSSKVTKVRPGSQVQQIIDLKHFGSGGKEEKSITHKDSTVKNAISPRLKHNSVRSEGPGFVQQTWFKGYRRTQALQKICRSEGADVPIGLDLWRKETHQSEQRNIRR